MKVVYLNITYECNSNCTFCAANHEKNGQIGRIDFNTIKKTIDKMELNPGDQVIINGGEPTIHPEIDAILDTLTEKGCLITLFTNGRSFKNREFVENIMSKNLHQVSIPLHGNRVVHDRITRCKGSYNETIQGLNNLKRFRKQTRVELKLVICKSNINTALETLQEINSLNVADTILISTLFQTSVALSNEEIVPAEDLIVVVRKIIDTLKSSEYKGDVILYGFPLCLLTNLEIEYVLSKTRNERLFSDDLEEVYIDYTRLGERIEHPNNICVINECQLHNYCQCGDNENYKMFRKELEPFI